MQIFGGGRQVGKTYRIVQMLKADPSGVLIVPNVKMANRLREQYGLNESQVVSINQGAKLQGREVNLYVDNLELLIGPLLSLRLGNNPVLAAACWTEDPPRLINNKDKLDSKYCGNPPRQERRGFLRKLIR